MEGKIAELETEKIEEAKTETNKHSIYDYLKENTAVLLAAVSAMVAIVTFFAKLVTLISARKELAFWEFSSSYATFGSESIVYTVILAIIFSCFITASSMLFSSTYEAYLQYKKFHLLAKYFLKKERHNIKRIVKKSKNGKITEVESFILQNAELIKKSTKESKKLAYKDLFFNLFFIFVLICCNSILFAIATVSDGGKAIWMVALAMLIVQLFTLWLLKILTTKTVIKKNELKRNCNDAEFIVKFFEEREYKEYPFNKIFINGIRSVLSNSNIISIVVMIILNCFILSCSFTFTNTDPIERSKTFQITTLDSIPYAIVYQDDEKYYLEEIKVKVEKAEGEEPKEILTVYTNRQRIITCDDIEIEVKKYDDIIKEHKPDNPQEKPNNE